MPMGPPFQRPEPKSACRPVFAPMLAIYWPERTAVGSAAMLRFQMLLAGKTGQGPPATAVGLGVTGTGLGKTQAAGLVIAPWPILGICPRGGFAPERK